MQTAMSNVSTWDWPFLFYVGTVLLRMPEFSFWRCTPRKIKVLFDVYTETNTAGGDPDDSPSKKVQKGFIDNIM